MRKVVREQVISPLLELLALGAREEIRVSERDRRVAVAPDGVDSKNACRLPMASHALVVLDRAEAEKRPQGLKESQVASRHRHRKDELQARSTVAVRTALTDRSEATLRRDKAAERVTGPLPRFDEAGKKWWRRWGSNPRSSCVPRRRSTRLSYAPRSDNGTSGHSGLECLTYRTHVCIMTWGYDNHP